MKLDKIVIWGTSGHAKVVTEVVLLSGKYDIYGYIDNMNNNRKGKLFLSKPILGGEEILENIKKLSVNKMILGFGDCKARLILWERMKELGFQFITAIHPNSVISHSSDIGEGTVVMAGAIVNPGSRIGKNVILNTNSCVEHDCIIEDGCHICPGVTIGGHTNIRKGTWIGIGSIIKDHLDIGNNVLIGAGSNVINNIEDNSMVYGNPARIITES
jgi:UDP-N-acetylbacillosamine N-acetyltransferase